MKTIDHLADLATGSSTTVTKLRTPRERALALLDAARRHDRVEWQATGTTVALLSVGAGEYSAIVDGVLREKGTLGAVLETVEQLSAALAGSPTPTARPYEQWGLWADVQDGHFMYYAMGADGGWDEDPAEVEFTCQHMLDRVNADFGTAFTLDEFDEDCTCAA